MENKIVKIILLAIMLTISVLTIESNAAVAVQIVPTKNITVNTTVSNSFLLARGLTNRGQVLEGTSVTSNLVTNADWGAVSYLTNSAYGSKGQYQNLGTDSVKVTIKDKSGTEASYYSTTGNKTGVMNWGSKWTQTASLIQAYINSPTGSTNVTSLYENINSGFVEKINTSNSNFTKMTTRGQALSETQGNYGAISCVSMNTTYPIASRNGLFGFNVGNVVYGGTSGAEYSNATYRVVFWN